MTNKWIKRLLLLIIMLVISSVFGPASLSSAAPFPSTIYVYGTMGGNGWYVSNVYALFDGRDYAGGWRINKIEYSLNGGATWQPYPTYPTFTADGAYTILARTWYDASTVESPPVARTFKIDKTVPVTTISSGGTPGNKDWYASDATVTLGATDTLSGLRLIEYSLDGGSTWQPYSSPFTVSAEGTTTVLARAWDNAGNSGLASRDVKIDRTAPAVSETVATPQVAKQRKGAMVNISYQGTAVDTSSGLYAVNTQLIDEYGVYSQNLGSSLSGTVSVEAWANGTDQNGRTYIFRLTVTDLAGNQATIDAVTRITHEASVALASPN